MRAVLRDYAFGNQVVRGAARTPVLVLERTGRPHRSISFRIKRLTFSYGRGGDEAHPPRQRDRGRRAEALPERSPVRPFEPATGFRVS